MTQKKMEQIKCYCGHTTYCDCGPLEEKSAVEWFQEQIIKIVNGTCELSEIQIFEQAKAMEKEQIEKAFDDGYAKSGITHNAQEYYKEIFKNIK